MAPLKSRVYGWRLGILVFLAFALVAPIVLLLGGPRDDAAPYMLYALVFTGMLAAWGVYGYTKHRVRGRELYRPGR